MADNQKTTPRKQGDDKVTPLEEVWVELWIKQSELMWRTAMAVPLLVVPIIAGWYAVRELQDALFWQRAILGVGILGMFFNFLILLRMAQFFNAFGAKIKQLMPEVRKPLFRLSGYVLAMLTPVMLACMLIAMLFINEVPGSAKHTVMPEAGTEQPIPQSAAEKPSISQ